jgi:uncharacterized protein YkwD
LGLQECKWDDRLAKAAQKHADDLHDRRASPHDGFPERVFDSGFPHQKCKIRNSGFGNVSEGISHIPDDPLFFPDRPRFAVKVLNDNGGHGDDFRDPGFNRIGMGYKGVHFVLDYGADCGGPPLDWRRMQFPRIEREVKTVTREMVDELSGD